MQLIDALVSEFDREIARTRALLDAIPATVDWSWKPHDKSMTLGRLAGHTAELSGPWAITVLTEDRHNLDPARKPYVVSDKAQMLAAFDASIVTTRKALAALAGYRWEEHWQLVAGDQVWLDLSRYEAYRDCVMNHLIHHRSQLGVYLRLLDLPIPGTYGPSADVK